MGEVPDIEGWARLRFAIVGPLLASPPARGELGLALRELSKTTWTHPGTGEPTHFGVSTIERWYYLARAAPSDPVAALRRRRRRDRGQHPSMHEALVAALERQYRQHPAWSYLLHTQNLEEAARRDPSLAPMPSYSTVRRFMKARGWLRLKRRGKREGQPVATKSREVRSYEVEHVHGLWHLDFHHGSLAILTASGEWLRPLCFAVLDDRSRLVCHLQWYLGETAQNLVHGLEQAILKRGLPRALLTDNGSAMLAEETRRGLRRLGIQHKTTLAYSPYQNGKQEVFWSQVEGRLLAMLEGCHELTLAQLNEASLAWVEREYQRTVHSETGQSPLDRFLDGPSVGRDAPDLETLRRAFCAETTRRQRRSDGTLTLHGVRFEVPNAWRHVERLHLRYASWDLSRLYLIDEPEGRVLTRLWPLDKARHSDARRRVVEPDIEGAGDSEEEDRETGPAPLLQRYLEESRNTGLPPAYWPQPSDENDDDKEHE